MASWYPSEYYIHPSYSTIPVLRISDAVRPTLSFRQRRRWTNARNKALAMWAEAGFVFKARDTVSPYLDDRVTLALEQVPDGVPGAWAAWEYRVNRIEVPEGPLYGTDPGSMGGWIAFDPEYLAALFLMSAKDWANGRMKYLVAHELGHCLGFGHGGNGIMASPWFSNRVNAEELAAARAYWGLP